MPKQQLRILASATAASVGQPPLKELFEATTVMGSKLIALARGFFFVQGQDSWLTIGSAFLAMLLL